MWALVSIVTFFGEVVDVRHDQRIIAAAEEPIVRMVPSPMGVLVLDAPIDNDQTDACLNLADLGVRERAEYQALINLATRGDRENGTRSGKGWHSVERPERVEFASAQYAHKAPMRDFESGGLTRILDDYGPAQNASVEGKRREVATFGKSNGVGENIGAQLAASGAARDVQLPATDHEEQQRQNSDRIADRPKQPSVNMSGSSERLAGFLTVAGISVACAAWLASERYARVAFACWIIGALLFVIGLFGLSDSLCAGYVCQ